MKRSILILAVAALTGCALDRKADFDVSYPIEFQPAMYIHSAPAEAGTYPEDQSFGVSAWTLPQECCWDDDRESAQQHMPLSEISLDAGGKWVPPTEVLWPTKDERVTFLAYSPYEEACGCSREEGVVWTGVDVLKDQTDLLYTEPQEDMNKLDCGGVVTLPFKHAMCLVDFRVKHRVQQGHKIIVNRIMIDSVHGKGTFRSLSDPAWELDESIVSLPVFEGSHEAGKVPGTVGREWLLIPQELDTPVTVEYEYVHESGSHLIMNLKTARLKTKLESGMQYTITLSIGIDDVKFLTELIEHRMK